MDLRLPDPAAFPGLRPVIVYVHSGGWIGGERSAVPDVTLAQVARGYAVVSIDYQLATLSPDGQPVSSFPGAVWDVKRAVRFVKANTEVWDIDPSRVVLMGASAGGHLAAFVGATHHVLDSARIHVHPSHHDHIIRPAQNAPFQRQLIAATHARLLLEISLSVDG